MAIAYEVTIKYLGKVVGTKTYRTNSALDAINTAEALMQSHPTVGEIKSLDGKSYLHVSNYEGYTYEARKC